MAAPARQWPDNICSGEIAYSAASNYEGFALRDVQHGIPTFGAVSASQVHIFNYPGQTEAIAAQLVHRWNCHEQMLAALKAARQGAEYCDDLGDIINAAIDRADDMSRRTTPPQLSEPNSILPPTKKATDREGED